MIDLKLALPEHFLEEEDRAGFHVTRQMKEIWAVQLDLLAEFDRICKKHHITYYASGGTMLGAVRHQGFIPWDDDIDLMMLRKDYDKLCTIADEEFRHPYFFQTEYSDRGSLRGHAQLRNSLTTAILESERRKHFTFNQGIFIDIFPLDSVIPDGELFAEQAGTARKLRNQYFRYAGWSIRYYEPAGYAPKDLLKRAAHSLLGGKIAENRTYDIYYRKFEDICQQYNHIETEMISTLSFQFENRQHFKYREDYAETIEVPFEFMTIPIGKNYDHALQTRYGDYMKYVVGTSVHGGVLFDTDKPYTEYLSR